MNLALAAIDHFLRFVGLGAAEVSRERLPQAAPRALEGEELLAFVRAAGRAAVRDRAIGLLLVYSWRWISMTRACRVARRVAVDPAVIPHAAAAYRAS